MFICVSLNPAIDKRLLVERLSPGQVHRVRSVHAHAGGKSAHVAMSLRALGEKPHWVGPIGGATGNEVVAGLCSLGIQVCAFPVNKATRTNLEILEDHGRVTELLEPGDAYSADELNGFTKLCGEIFQSGAKGGVVIFSGSLPRGTNPVLYAQLISLARSFGHSKMLDTSGEPLKAALSAEPDLVKPNRSEAEALLGLNIASINEAKLAVQRILAMGARRVALSLGSEGMLYSAGRDQPILFAPALRLKIRSAVGCGDAALAGFARSLSAGADPEQTLKVAAACAAANCTADSPGAIRGEDVEKYLAEIRVEALR